MMNWGELRVAKSSSSEDHRECCWRGGKMPAHEALACYVGGFGIRLVFKNGQATRTTRSLFPGLRGY
jgi:hypothetical protein